jgi:tetratricopeptide (TPR) repeat protein/transglutaminase-like putative cysteine protease
MVNPVFFASLLLLGRLDSPTTDHAEALAKVALARANEPRGAAALIRLHGLKDEVDDLNLLAEPYFTIVARRSTDPLVRALARELLIDVERARGRTVRAQDQLKELGFVQDVWVVGGFDNEGKGGCDTDFGPEAAPDLSASYPSKRLEVTWRKPTAKSPDGYVDLSVPLKPSTEAVGYALTWLSASAETRAQLSLGVSGGFRLFVNGVKVAQSDRYNTPRPDQHRLEVRLRKGLNRVLVKVCQERGPFGFYLRAERPVGAPGSVTVALPDTVPPLEKGSAPGPVKLPTLAEAVLTKVAQAPTDAELRADAAVILEWTRAWEEKERTPMLEAEKAADARPQDVSLQLIAAQLQLDDANHRRVYLERALAVEPRHPYARLLLAQHELAMEHPALALVAAEALLVEHPRFAAAWLVKARALEALGEKVASLRAVEAAFEQLHLVPRLAREAVAASRRQDRVDEAIARARMALSLRFDDTATRRTLAGLLADLGRLDEAIDQYKKVLALDPLDLGTVLRLAELCAANGRPSEARAFFDTARALSPDEPDVHEREGRALLHLGDTDAALLAFGRTLKLRPQHPTLKDVVRTLRGDEQEGATPHALAVAPLLEGLGDGAGEDAVTLAEVTAVKVQTTGLSSRFQQLAVKVFTQRGVEAFRQLPITYSPDRQEVRVLKARITRGDGSIIDSFGDGERNINEPWTGMYYDARARVLTFPALAPGDVLEVQWRVDDTATENLLSDYWGDVDAVQATVPRRRYRYVVDMPASRPLSWNAATLPPWVTASREPKGDRVLYRFEATDVKKVVPEPQMPGWAEVATPLHVSTYQSWDAVGRYWWGLVRDQLTPNAELQKTVDTVLKGVDRKKTADVVAALYGFVVTNTRYVALEFGIHGYKPYRVDRVLARRFGDCKDKASLIVAMLKLAGVDARLVLLRMRSLGALPPEPASLAAFNHAIAYVPALDLYLDGTAEFHGSRELPSADRVANVLVVEPDGRSRFLVTPEASPRDNLTTLSLDVALKADGSASAKGRLSATGQAAPELRLQYQTPATRQATFEQVWANSFPGVAATGVTVSDVTKLEAPVTMGFAMTMPRYAESGGGLLRFYPFGASRAFTQVLAPLPSRTSDVVLPGVWTNRFEFSYALPPGWTAGELPPKAEVASPFGSLTIEVAKHDGALKVTGELVMATARVAAKDYPAFRAWLLEVDQAFSKKLTVQTAGPKTAAVVGER